MNSQIGKIKHACYHDTETEKNNYKTIYTV